MPSVLALMAAFAIAVTSAVGPVLPSVAPPPSCHGG
jgi:hypothetical protein